MTSAATRNQVGATKTGHPTRPGPGGPRCPDGAPRPARRSGRSLPMLGLPAVDAFAVRVGAGRYRRGHDHDRDRRLLGPPAVAVTVACQRLPDLPLMYRFRVIDRLPEPPSAAATRGTVVHAVLERLFDLPATSARSTVPLSDARPSGERTARRRARAGSAVRRRRAGRRSAPCLPGRRRAALLERYFPLEDPTRLEPAERELHVDHDARLGLTLRGYVDRLDVAPARATCGWSTTRPGKAPQRRLRVQARMFQMRLLRAGAVAHARRGAAACCSCSTSAAGEVLRYEPDEADLLATERKLEALWDAIRRATEAGDWRPSPRGCATGAPPGRAVPGLGWHASATAGDRSGDPRTSTEVPSPRGFGDEVV